MINEPIDPFKALFLISITIFGNFLTIHSVMLISVYAPLNIFPKDSFFISKLIYVLDTHFSTRSEERDVVGKIVLNFNKPFIITGLNIHGDMHFFRHECGQNLRVEGTKDMKNKIINATDISMLAEVLALFFCGEPVLAFYQE